MARRKISTTVYLDPPQFEALRERSAKTGVPYAAIIRRAIERELRTEPISPIDFLAASAPEFLAGLSPLEKLVLVRMTGGAK